MQHETLLRAPFATVCTDCPATADRSKKAKAAAGMWRTHPPPSGASPVDYYPFVAMPRVVTSDRPSTANAGQDDIGRNGNASPRSSLVELRVAGVPTLRSSKSGTDLTRPSRRRTDPRPKPPWHLLSDDHQLRRRTRRVNFSEGLVARGLALDRKSMPPRSGRSRVEVPGESARPRHRIVQRLASPAGFAADQ
jgi:hypothetical protein